MAAKFETSQTKGSDLLYDVCCSVCEDDGINKEGLFHCQKCSKAFCDECVVMHNKLLKNHLVTAKCHGDNWPDSTTLDDTMELCEEHSTEKLTMFCEDHEKLLCQVCHLRNHRQCSQVVLLADKVKSATQRMNVAQMTNTVEQLQKSLHDMVDREKQNIKSVQVSYERVLKEVLDSRRQININLDRLQQNTLNELEIIHASLNASLEDNTKRCLKFISKLKEYGTKLKNTMPLERSFITLRKCLDQTNAADSIIKNMMKNAGTDIKFQSNRHLIKCLADCIDLGKITSRICDPQHNVSIQDWLQYNVQTDYDKSKCSIYGICETSNGDLVVSDSKNCCVKLLNQAYKVIDQVQLPICPWSVCNISSFNMAVTVSKGRDAFNGIHFLRVDNGNIRKIKALKMNHSCYGIVHHDANLFVTSGTALHKYAMDGKLVKKLYEDSSNECAVVGVGVSPDGKRIYVTDNSNGKLLTLTRDGAITATLQAPEFKHWYVTCNIHVTATGQVFVLGEKSVSQVDTDGKILLNTITLDVSGITSVYFNEDTRTFVVGFSNNGNILEFKTKTILTS